MPADQRERLAELRAHQGWRVQHQTSQQLLYLALQVARKQQQHEDVH